MMRLILIQKFVFRNRDKATITIIAVIYHYMHNRFFIKYVPISIYIMSCGLRKGIWFQKDE